MEKYQKISKEINNWALKNFLKIVVFNFVIIGLFLLRSAGYFDPYFYISVNFIVVVALVLSIILLSAKSKVLFIISLLFWIFSGLLKLLNLDVWAERTAIYCIEALVIGIILLYYDS